MRTIIHKLWWAWDFDKEEAWLNKLAAQGLALVSVGFCRYEFEDCTPGEYTFRLQLLENTVPHPESQKYLAFLEETGVEHIGSWLRWVYLRKKTADGGFELFSDNESRIRHLSLVISLLLLLGIANLICGINNVMLYFINRIPLSLLGIINLVLGIACCIGVRRLIVKRRRLKNEQQLFE